MHSLDLDQVWNYLTSFLTIEEVYGILRHLRELAVLVQGGKKPSLHKSYRLASWSIYHYLSRISRKVEIMMFQYYSYLDTLSRLPHQEDVENMVESYLNFLQVIGRTEDMYPILKESILLLRDYAYAGENVMELIDEYPSEIAEIIFPYYKILQNIDVARLDRYIKRIEDTALQYLLNYARNLGEEYPPYIAP